MRYPSCLKYQYIHSFIGLGNRNDLMQFHLYKMYGTTWTRYVHMKTKCKIPNQAARGIKVFLYDSSSSLRMSNNDKCFESLTPRQSSPPSRPLQLPSNTWYRLPPSVEDVLEKLSWCNPSSAHEQRFQLLAWDTTFLWRRARKELMEAMHSPLLDAFILYVKSCIKLDVSMLWERPVSEEDFDLLSSSAVVCWTVWTVSNPLFDKSALCLGACISGRPRLFSRCLLGPHCLSSVSGLVVLLPSGELALQSSLAVTSFPTLRILRWRRDAMRFLAHGFDVVCVLFCLLSMVSFVSFMEGRLGGKSNCPELMLAHDT